MPLAALRPGGNLAFHDTQLVVMEPGDVRDVPLVVALRHYDRLTFDEDPLVSLVPGGDLTGVGFPRVSDMLERPGRPSTPVPGVTAVIVASRHRNPTVLAETRASLARQSVHPFVFSAKETPCAGEQRRAAYRALLLTAYQADTAALLLEDDVDVDALLVPHLQEASEVDRITFLYVTGRLTPPAARELVEQGKRFLHPFQPRGDYTSLVKKYGRGEHPLFFDRFIGGQAVYLPAWTVKDLVTDPRYWVGRQTSFDVMLRDRILQRIETDARWQPLGAFPNPVQHRAPPNLATTVGIRQKRQRGVHSSSTFGGAV